MPVIDQQKTEVFILTSFFHVYIRDPVSRVID